MTRIHINASTPYDVVIEAGSLQRIAVLLRLSEDKPDYRSFL